jgi:hypothetical protein
VAAPDPVVVRGRWRFRAFLSTVVMFACLYIAVADGYDAAMRTWATGTIGLLIGYWLR